MQNHPRPSYDPRFDTRTGNRDDRARARERSPIRDARQRPTPGYNNRRTRSPLPRRDSYPRHDYQNIQKESYAGSSPGSPNAVQGVSMLVSPPAEGPANPTSSIKPTDSRKNHGTTLQRRNDLTALIEDFARVQADTCHWFSQSYTARKQSERQKESLGRLNDTSEYGSQATVIKAQLAETEKRWKNAEGRYQQAVKLHQDHLLRILSHPNIKALFTKAAAPVAAATATEPASETAGSQSAGSSLEQRLAALEQSHEAQSAAQSQKIAVLEAQLKASTAGATARDERIDELQKTVDQLTGKVSGANEQVRQLKEEIRKLSTASQRSHSIAGTPEFTDLQANVKALDLKLRDHQVESRRFDEQYKEINNWKTKMPGNHRNMATKDDLQASTAENERKMTDLVQNFRELQRVVNDVSASVEERRTAVADQDLTPRVLALERTTCKQEDLDAIQPEALKAILRRDFRAEIAQEVSQQMAVLPPRAPTTSASPAPAPAQANLDLEAIAGQVTLRIQEKLNIIKDRIGELLKKERAEREELSVNLASAVADLARLSPRITALENNNTASVSHVDLERIRSECESIARAVGTALDIHTREAKKETETTMTEIGKVSGWVAKVDGKLNHLTGQTNQQYMQLMHEHANLLTWQQQFSTRELWAEAVAQMQELVPKGALAKMRNLEAKVENISRMVQANGAGTGR